MQEQPSLNYRANQEFLAQRKAANTVRRRRASKLSAALGIVTASLWFGACSAEDQPAPMPAATGGSAGAGGGASTASCEVPCVAAYLKRQCYLCHGKLLQSAMLDLENAGYTDRMKDKPATHLMVKAGAVCPTGDLLINTTTPNESWFLKKMLVGQFGNCGDLMPQSPVPPPPTAAEMMCMQTYVSCVAGGKPVSLTGSGGMPSGGTGGMPSGGGGAGGMSGGSGGAGGSGGSGGSGGANGGTGGT